jgi:hypothetical protein
MNETITIPPGKLHLLCNAVFEALRVSGAAYVFMDRQSPRGFLVLNDRRNLDQFLTDEGKRYMFVNMYERCARAQDVISDALGAHRTGHTYEPPVPTRTNWIVAAVVALLGVAAVGLLVYGATELGALWFFSEAVSNDYVSVVDI